MIEFTDINKNLPDGQNMGGLIQVRTDYFRFIKLRRERVITPSHGEIDFSRDDIPLEICKELFEKGFPYLELAELGKQELYGIASVAEPVEAKQKRKKL